MQGLYCTAMRFEAEFFSNHDGAPGPARVAVLGVDFDETCSRGDTIGAVIAAAIDAAAARAEGGHLAAPAKAAEQRFRTSPNPDTVDFWTLKTMLIVNGGEHVDFMTTNINQSFHPQCSIHVISTAACNVLYLHLQHSFQRENERKLLWHGVSLAHRQDVAPISAETVNLQCRAGLGARVRRP